MNSRKEKEGGERGISSLAVKTFSRRFWDAAGEKPEGGKKRSSKRTSMVTIFLPF